MESVRNIFFSSLQILISHWLTDVIVTNFIDVLETDTEDHCSGDDLSWFGFLIIHCCHSLYCFKLISIAPTSVISLDHFEFFVSHFIVSSGQIGLSFAYSIFPICQLCKLDFELLSLAYHAMLFNLSSKLEKYFETDVLPFQYSCYIWPPPPHSTTAPTQSQLGVRFTTSSRLF